MSPGFKDLNIADSATQSESGPAPHDTPEMTSRDGFLPPASSRQRKRRRAGKGKGWNSRCVSQGCLDRALVSFLSWQQSAEERLLSLEEAQLEKEIQADERREQREEKRAEQERRHELHLFSMLTGALVAVRQGAPATTTATTGPSAPPPAHSSASVTATSDPSVSPPLSQPPFEAGMAQAVSSKETMKPKPSTSVKACNEPESGAASLIGAEAPGHSVYLSERGNSIRKHQGILQEGYAQYGLDRYHDRDNPNVSVSVKH